MMETPENLLSFFTANHSKHDSHWRMTGANISVVCVACLVELLESTDVLHLRKRKVLREVVFLMSSNQHLLELLAQNARIASHLCSTITDLLSTENELLMSTAIEALDIITVKLRSETLVAEIVEKLTVQIFRLNNLKKSYPFVLALGRLLKSIPVLSFLIAKDSPNLVEYFFTNILFPEDNIKAAFLFALVQICSNEDALNALSFQMKEKICNQTCAVVACCISTDVQMNALGVLKLFSADPDLLNSTLKPSSKGTCPMLESLKRLMLSTNEAVQIGAIQCITQILKIDTEENVFTKAFLTSGIAEMLLEDLESSNDIVLGSVYCSLDYMVKTQIFYSEGYSVYGIESIIVGISKAIKLKNPEIIRQSLRVLSLILMTQPSSVQLFPSEKLCKLCANVLHESLKSSDHRILTQAAYAVEHFLSVDHFPPSIEFETITPLVSTVISHLQKFTKPRIHFRNAAKGPLEEFLCVLLRVIKKTFQFVKEYRAREPTYAVMLARNNDSLSTECEAVSYFLESLWKAIDQICVPAMMLCYESVKSPTVLTNFFEILYLSVSNESSCRESFARKLTTGSFVRLSLEIKEKFSRGKESTELSDVVTGFLTELCLSLGTANERTQLEGRLTTSNIGCIRSPTGCLNVLAQSSVRKDTNDIIDESLFSTQCFCIELLYLSSAHDDEIVPAEELLMGLHKYLTLHPDLTILPRVTFKHLLFIWITSCNRLRSIPLHAVAIDNINVSQGILEQTLVKFEADVFDSIYIHDMVFVSWILSFDSLLQAFGRQVLILFLEREEIQNLCNNKMFHEFLIANLQSFRTFVSLVECREEAIVNRAVAVLETLFTANSDSPLTTTPRITLLANEIANIFHKMFLGHKTYPIQEQSISAILKVMTAAQMKVLAFDTRILYHVINLLTSTRTCQSLMLAAINYLNVTLAWDLEKDANRVAAMLLSNKTFCGYIQDILDSKLVHGVEQRDSSVNDVNFLASVIVLITSLLTSQPWQEDKDVHDPFKVDKKFMMNLANEKKNILRISSVVFWEVYLRIARGRSDKLVVSLSARAKDEEQPVGELSEVDLQVLHVYLQNSLVNDSETVRHCAVKCLRSFFSYVPCATSFASNPWNRIVLESQLSVLSVNIITPSLVLFCSLILYHASKQHLLKDVLRNAVNTILDIIPSISYSEQPELSWYCVNLLLQVLRLCDDLLAEKKKGAVATWLTKFRSQVEKSGDTVNNVRFYKLENVIMAKDLLKCSVCTEHELLDSALHLLEGKKMDEEYGETYNQ